MASATFWFQQGSSGHLHKEDYFSKQQQQQQQQKQIKGMQHAYKSKNTKLKLTVGPASKEVPESAIAAQPPAQNPDNDRYRI